MSFSEKRFVDCSFNAIFGDSAQQKNYAQSNRGHMEICGHRGGFKPQNSLQAFLTAVEHGIKMIELDVSVPVFHTFLGMAN
jgi:glycerophosphoryl diester phosphodiesterase